MRSLAVIKTDLVANHATGMLQRLKPMLVGARYTLNVFDHAVMPRSMQRGELLLQSISLHQRREISVDED
jgi:hypothetical protein